MAVSKIPARDGRARHIDARNGRTERRTDGRKGQTGAMDRQARRTDARDGWTGAMIRYAAIGTWLPGSCNVAHCGRSIRQNCIHKSNAPAACNFADASMANSFTFFFLVISPTIYIYILF